jgi:hypothetical protein
MKLMLKGALHVHSTYSDGEFTLAELRRVFLSEECKFVCMSDHAEYFDEAKVKAYRDECQSLSDDSFVLVPGLEYRCERQMHILGYGATAPINSDDPQTVIANIDSQGAVSVIAHPKEEFFEWIESFKKLPQGIEVWNTKYDGRYAPRPGTFATLQRLRERQPHMHAFYGQDLHWKKQFRGLFVELDCGAAEPLQIVRALADGKYGGQRGELSLPSSGVLPRDVLARFQSTHNKSQSRWQFMKRGKETLDRMGIKVPDSLKAQLRRMF